MTTDQKEMGNNIKCRVASSFCRRRDYLRWPRRRMRTNRSWLTGWQINSTQNLEYNYFWRQIYVEISACELLLTTDTDTPCQPRRSDR